MKNYLIVLVLFLSFNTKAQESGSLSLNLYGGYNFSDKVEFDFGYVDVKEGFQWGVGLEYFVQKYSSVELKYLRIDTDMDAYIGNQSKSNFLKPNFIFMVHMFRKKPNNCITKKKVF